MAKKRIHIISAVNAANVSKSGTTYTIRDVCGAVDDIVMNRRLYPADQPGRWRQEPERQACTAGHPKNSKASTSALPTAKPWPQPGSVPTAPMPGTRAGVP